MDGVQVAGRYGGAKNGPMEAQAPHPAWRLSRGGLGITLWAILAALLAPGLTQAAANPASITLGSQTLTECGTAPLSYCGSLSVPLDYGVPTGPHISIAYAWYPATAPVNGQASGTVVPVEGGPGYPSIESVSYSSLGHQSGYSAMYGDLLHHWNMLAIDNRGTGKSSPLSCHALQRFAGPTGTAAFQQATALCAEKLNHHWRYPDGSWVHASDLFTSTPAAEDMAGVIEALGLSKVDLYGDSYGSFFAQVFANHFPNLVHSVVLDSTYQADGRLDPLYRSTIESMPAAFDAACDRWQACSQAATVPAWSQIEELATSLREQPISGVVPGPTGARERIEMNVVGLVDLLSDAAEDTQIYRSLDAAAGAALNPLNPDPLPLLRLYAQREYEDEDYFQLPIREYSVELYLAVSCLDYPQLFDMGATSAVREAEFQALEARISSATFAPFGPNEWMAQDENTEAYSACIGWPSPTVAQPPTTRELALFPATLPVLVLGGEFDTWTPPRDVPKVLAEIGGKSQFVELANSTHVVGEGDTPCGDALVQQFVADPGATLNTSCAAAVPPIHAVGVYPAELSEQPPLEASAPSGATPEELQLASAAVATAGDAVAREQAIEYKLDHGLFGGTVRATHSGSVLTLSHDQLIQGVAISGTVTLASSPAEDGGETVLAEVVAKVRGEPSGSFTATWTTAGADALATVSGKFKQQIVAGSMPAP
jgi:pimeloyl-ACP methyl ester carboxylesterase